MSNVIRTLDQLDEEERIKLFIRERNEVLLSLDVDKFEEFWKRWDNPTPDGGWCCPDGSPNDSRLIMMHKARLHLPNESISADEKAKSRTWLKKHGYDEYIGGVRPEQERFR
jgi:hypothetical protein